MGESREGPPEGPAAPVTAAGPARPARVPTPPATDEATRRSMVGNRSKDTKPEMVVRRWLRAAGLPGYRLQWKGAEGRPDVAYPGRKVAIFVNGCFWHRCPYCRPREPRTHAQYWEQKFVRNQERDAEQSAALVREGWTVIVVWECRLKKRRVRRTMEEVAAEVRLSPSAPGRPGKRGGRLVTLGRTCVRGPSGLAAEHVRGRAPGQLRRGGPGPAGRPQGRPGRAPGGRGARHGRA